ncbi:oxygen-independent coproporphyrinogen-3 oxidase [Alkalispirillum mobile]|uniref:Coproporphyrinogen-III oxidase n=1 Tax=Alkalispirillum mobile TaxID=85925 RepID=A0A498C5S1_9GAMM|nr:oxygen-independent coproporphyrinogen III oxidase [Alkalispirillum mobile]RLK50337.1 oxygen-independent coproporphyrinogen-3 oxidase [Alkalispirillum mobile]
MDQTLQFDPAMLAKYNVSGPRYTSYPTAPQFHEGFDDQAYAEVAARSNEDPIPRPLSLYVHVPFCDTVCFYCACNKIITGNYARAGKYLDYLEKEVALQGQLFDSDRRVEQLHFGGGTPTYLNDEDLVRVMEMLSRHFSLEKGPEREFSIEIDPRAVRDTTIELLAELGFNRISVGVQDFDPDVQKAVNRIQPYETTARVIKKARSCGFRSTNMDLIYGLPLQTVETYARTLDRTLELRPERIAIYNYAHLPHLFKVQRQIRDGDLPGPDEKLAILEQTINRLTEAGYVYIGMDHFALPDDELARAQRAGTLHRNFQGYSTRAECDLVGLGVTSIGKVGETYSQNLRDIDAYYERLDAGRLPVFRGVELTTDDQLRRDVITEIMCHSRVDFREVEQRYDIVFHNYFRDALERLQGMQADGLVRIEGNTLQVEPRGRLLLRHVAMAFDAYLHADKGDTRYSKVI